MSIPFHVPHRTCAERTNLLEALDRQELAGNGHFAAKVQAALRRCTGASSVLLTHSCTAALEMAAILADIGPDDEVIIPTFTFCSTASAFARTGATLVFCDVDPDTMMAGPDHFAACVSARTKAIVPVHYGGVGADMNAILSDRRLEGLWVVEDAAQAFGASLGGRPLGTFGRLGCLSFHATKNLHGALAGALLINDHRLEQRARQVWERGTNRQLFFEGRVDRYTWTELGSSFCPTEFQAALLAAQLDACEEIAARRADVDAIYRQALKPLRERGEIWYPDVPACQVSNHHIFWILTTGTRSAGSLRAFMREHNIDCPAHFFPLHASPMGEKLGWKPDDLPEAVVAAERLVRLPLHSAMTVRTAQAVVSKIVEFFDQAAERPAA